MVTSPTSRWSDIGRLLLGGLLVLSGTIKLAVALLHGYSKLFMLETSLSGRPLLFVGALVLWAIVLAAGLSYLHDGISGLRRRSRSTGALS